jgi:hypothetical protein
MSRKNHTGGHRALRLALLWLVLFVACAGLARHLIALETRIRWEYDVRSEVGADMAVYQVDDPAAWAEHQRRTGARIAVLRREQGVTRALFFAVVLLGLVVAMWLFRPKQAQPARTGTAESN